jgi:prepilin-type N-terminal cleavage/methylation domain-containing protein
MFILKTAYNKGFTLLEVMISVAIIALIFTSLFRMQSSTIELASAGKFNSIAPILAKRLLVEIEQDVVNWSESEGDFGENFPGITWTCEILDSSFGELDFISEENQKSLKKIDIKIIGSTGSSGHRSYEISTWRVARE